MLVEVRHHHLLVGVLLQLERDAHIFGRDVFDVEELRQLPAEHHLGDALHQLRLVHRVGHAVDVNRLRRSRLVADVPRAAQPDRPAPGSIQQLDLFG